MDETGDLSAKRISEDEFLSLRNEWNDLLSRSTSNDIFLRWEWMRCWWDVFKKNCQLFVIAVRRGSRLVGIAPFYIESTGITAPRRIRFCSEQLAPDYLDIIAEREVAGSVVKQVFQVLEQHADKWDMLALDDLLATSTLMTHRSGIDRLSPGIRDSIGCPFIGVNGTFETYFDSLSDIGKTSLEKKMRNLFKNPDIKRVQVENIETLSTGLADLFRLHEARPEGSDFTQPDVQEFHRRLSRNFLEQGMLRFQIIYDRTVPIAAHYAFFYQNKVYFFNQGFNPAYKKWSAGTINIYLTVQAAFNEGAREYDFLKGEEPFKSGWANSKHEQFLLTAYSPTIRGSFWRNTQRLTNNLRRIKRALVR